MGSVLGSRMSGRSFSGGCEGGDRDSCCVMHDGIGVCSVYMVSRQTRRTGRQRVCCVASVALKCFYTR